MSMPALAILGTLYRLYDKCGSLGPFSTPVRVTVIPLSGGQ